MCTANSTPGGPPQPSQPTIVYAIGVAWDGQLRTTLPLFSRVNLRNHAKTIRRADLDVALVRIVPTPFRDSPAVAVPAQQDTEVGQARLF